MVRGSFYGPTLAARSDPKDYSLKVKWVMTILSSGINRWPQWNSAPAGKLIHAAARDVTEHKLFEDFLTKSGAKYRSPYESMMDGYVLADMGGRIQKCNESYREMTGYSADELLGLTVRTSKKDGHFAEVSIRDVGPGFEEHNASRLFDSFSPPNPEGWAWASPSVKISSILTEAQSGPKTTRT